METKIKISGDSQDAVSAVAAVKNAMKAATASAAELARASVAGMRDTVTSLRAGVTAQEGFARGALKMTAGVLGAESAMAGMRLAVHALGASVREYIATNEEASAQFAALGDHAAQLRQRFGELVAGGENARVITGALAASMDALRASLANTDATQRIVRASLAALIDGFATAVQVVGLAQIAWGSMQVALTAARGAMEVWIAGFAQFGAAMMNLMIAPIEAVTQSLRTMVNALASVGERMGGRAAEVTRGLADAFGAADDRVSALRDSFAEVALDTDLVARTMASARAEIALVSSTAFDGAATTAQLAQTLRETADATRDGTIASIEYTAALATETSGARAAAEAVIALTAAEAKREANSALRRGGIGQTGDKDAAALASLKQAARDAEAVAIETADARRASSAELASQRIAAALALEEAAMQRRRDVAQSSGASLGEALALGVSAQKQASQQMIGIVMREVQARIAAAVATSALASATPGGQFIAAALVAAIGVATSQLAAIGASSGGAGGGGRGGGSTTNYAPSITVNYQSTGGGTRSDAEEIARAVEDAQRRGMMRGGAR